MEYSLFTMDIESSTSEILKTCRELGITIVAFGPIGRGILTGQFQCHADIPEGDLRRMLPKYSEENFPSILELVQVALAWLLAQGPEIIPIPGTKSTTKMDENAAAAMLRLSDQEVEMIRTLVERTEIKGTRYPAA
jgi:aryl-alcohol dehydrogenase-like predicted oxidoreductase